MGARKQPGSATDRRRLGQVLPGGSDRRGVGPRPAVRKRGGARHWGVAAAASHLRGQAAGCPAAHAGQSARTPMRTSDGVRARPPGGVFANGGGIVCGWFSRLRRHPDGTRRSARVHGVTYAVSLRRRGSPTRVSLPLGAGAAGSRRITKERGDCTVYSGQVLRIV